MERGAAGESGVGMLGGGIEGSPPPSPLTSPKPHLGNPPPQKLIPGGARRALRGAPPPWGAPHPPEPSQGSCGVGGLSAQHRAQCTPPSASRAVPACLCHHVSPPHAVTCKEKDVIGDMEGEGTPGPPGQRDPQHGLTWHLRPPRVGGARGCGQSRCVPWGGTWGQGGVRGRGDRC